jgi:hypothetical protein
MSVRGPLQGANTKDPLPKGSRLRLPDCTHEQLPTDPSARTSLRAPTLNHACTIPVDAQYCELSLVYLRCLLVRALHDGTHGNFQFSEAQSGNKTHAGSHFANIMIITPAISQFVCRVYLVQRPDSYGQVSIAQWINGPASWEL